MSLRPGELRGILQSIYDSNNELTPELVLDEASDVKHPLHHRFTWDDSEAAHLYRIEEARTLIRSVKVTYADRPDGSPKSVRAFVTPRGPGVPTGVYKPVEDVLVDPIQRQILLRDMRREAEAFKRRWSHMTEYGEIVAGIAQEEGTKTA